MSLRKTMLLALFTVLVAVTVLIAFVLWSGRGILESTQAKAATDTEWLTVTNRTYEFRGTAYRTPEALSAGLSQLQPKPQHVTVRWLSAADPSSSRAVPSAQIEQAREALLKAGIATPSAFVANEVFTSATSASSGAR